MGCLVGDQIFISLSLTQAYSLRMWVPVLLSLVLSLSALAAPSRKYSTCDVSKAKIDLPTNQTALVQPSEPVSYIAVAIGTQNYTCTNGSYTNVGAVAELFDISCFYNTPLFTNIQDLAYAVWELALAAVTPQEVISVLHAVNMTSVLGQHYFVTNPITGQGTDAKWDFTSSGVNAGNAEAFVVAAKNATLNAPTGSQDVTWVRLTSIQGQLAQEVYRVDTRGGQLTGSCAAGSPDVAVKYAAKYWFYGGTVKKSG